MTDPTDERRSLHLMPEFRVIAESAEREPVVMVNRGQPRLVVMSAAEFRRLKAAAGEPVPAAAMPRVPLVLIGRGDGTPLLPDPGEPPGER